MRINLHRRFIPEEQRLKDESGNCYAACIAMLCGLPFDELKVDVGAPDTWTRQKEIALNNRMTGLLHTAGYALLHAGTRMPMGLSLATGDSPRGDFCHCWIALDGKPYYNPHPSNEFTPNVIHYDVIIPIMGLIEAAE